MFSSNFSLSLSLSLSLPLSVPSLSPHLLYIWSQCPKLINECLGRVVSLVPCFYCECHVLGKIVMILSVILRLSTCPFFDLSLPHLSSAFRLLPFPFSILFLTILSTNLFTKIPHLDYINEIKIEMGSNRFYN